jgi:23S rRNA (adenine2503-C2)-methyltransferase
MPAEKLFSITDVVSMLRPYDWSHQRRVSFEYICFENNTSLRYAKELLQLLKGLNCRVNLIRFHEGVENIRKSDNMPVFQAAA